MLRLMICFIKQRTLKRSPKKPWLMLHALLMNLELNKNILLLKRKLNALLSLKLWSLIRDWLKLMKLLPREDAMPWLSLNHASENWKLSLEAYKARLQSLTSASKKLNAALNLAKYRKAQQELEEAEDRSKIAGNQLSLV